MYKIDMKVTTFCYETHNISLLIMPINLKKVDEYSLTQYISGPI